MELSFLNNLKKYLLSNNSFDDNDIIYLKYNTTIDQERSFISLGATLIPVSILIDYYLNGKNSEFLNYIDEVEFNFEIGSNIYEIFSGYDTSVASKYLESTMVESGIGIPIVHDKYSYCHGRSTFVINYNAIAIYYNRNTKFDKIPIFLSVHWLHCRMTLCSRRNSSDEKTKQLQKNLRSVSQSTRHTSYLLSGLWDSPCEMIQPSQNRRRCMI